MATYGRGYAPLPHVDSLRAIVTMPPPSRSLVVLPTSTGCCQPPMFRSEYEEETLQGKVGEDEFKQTMERVNATYRRNFPVYFSHVIPFIISLPIIIYFIGVFTGFPPLLPFAAPVIIIFAIISWGCILVRTARVDEEVTEVLNEANETNFSHHGVEWRLGKERGVHLPAIWLEIHIDEQTTVGKPAVDVYEDDDDDYEGEDEV